MYNAVMYIFSHRKKLKMNKHNSIYNNILVINVKSIKFEEKIENESATSNIADTKLKPEMEVDQMSSSQSQREVVQEKEQSIHKTDSEELVNKQQNVSISEIDVTHKSSQSKPRYEMANIQASLIVSGKIVATFDETITSVDENGNIVTTSDIPSVFAQLERWIGIVSRTHGVIGSWASWDFYTKKAIETAAQEHKKYPSFLKKKHILVKEYFDDKYVNKKPTRKSSSVSSTNTKEQKQNKNNEFKGFATIKKALGFLKCKLDGNGLTSNDVANVLLRGRFNLNRPIVKVKTNKGRNNKQRHSHSFNQSKN